MGLVLACLLAAACLTAAQENKGAEEIKLYGGKKGDVLFPHHRHQAALEDCLTCHDIFPQETGSIDRLKAEGALKKKQVMNRKCTKCHRVLKKEGKPSGPTSCKKCHTVKT